MKKRIERKEEAVENNYFGTFLFLSKKKKTRKRGRELRNIF